jgi:hypothetical protein
MNAHCIRQRRLFMNCPPPSLAFISTLKQAVVAVALTTGFFAAAAHFYAILRGTEKPQVERFTGYGLFLGAALSLLFIALAAILNT